MSEKLSDEQIAELEEFISVVGLRQNALVRQEGRTLRLNTLRSLLNAARAEARPAVDREAVARVLSPEAFYGVSQWMDRLHLNQIDALDEVQRWAKARFDAKKKADAILALLSPATSPGEGSSGAESAARIASDHAASETPRKSEEG